MKLSISIVILYIFQLCFIAPGSASPLEKNQSVSPSSLKLYGKVDVVISACSAAGITLSSNSLPSTINKIRLGSPAFYGNLYVEDKVLSAEISDNRLSLLIERKGVQYTAQLHTNPSANLLADKVYSIPLKTKTNNQQPIVPPAPTSPQTKPNNNLASLDNSAQNTMKITEMFPPVRVPPSSWESSLEETKLNGGAQADLGPSRAYVNTNKHYATIQDVLIDHDLVLIVDHSESMDTPDCPGKVSRWDWCCQQTTELAQAAAEAANSITVVLFNDNYRVFDNIHPDEISAIFNEYHPSGGTVLGRPLQKELDQYFRTRLKPITIVIITDGEPEDRTSMARLVKETSDRLQYWGEITITFLLISNEVNRDQLQAKLGLLPNSSVQEGGLVDIIPFSSVSSKGVQQTLLDELKAIRLSTNKSMQSKASQYATGVSMDKGKHKNFLLW